MLDIVHIWFIIILVEPSKCTTHLLKNEEYQMQTERDDELPENLFLIESVTEEIRVGYSVDKFRRIKLSSAVIFGNIKDESGRCARVHPQEDGTAIVRRAKLGKLGEDKHFGYTHLEEDDDTVYVAVRMLNLVPEEKRGTNNIRPLAICDGARIVTQKGTMLVLEFKEAGISRCLGVDETWWEIEWKDDAISIIQIVSDDQTYYLWVSALKKFVRRKNPDILSLRTLQFLKYFSNTKRKRDSEQFVLQKLPKCLKKIKESIRAEAA